jgi:2-C-methyl-D-erythritol 4-phosphate cytidylyltransferase
LIGLVLAAAGSGSRFGASVPKQFLPLDGVPLYLRALEPFEPHVAEAVIVAPADWVERVRAETRDLWGGRRIVVEAGGPQRQDSVWRGVCRLSPGVDLVLAHDAARPFVTARLIREVIDQTRRVGACIPGIPVAETVKEVVDDQVSRTLDRGRLILVQTPQGFRRDLLTRAFQKATEEGFYGTDEAMLVERIGAPVRVVQGEPGNVKITRKEDLGTRHDDQLSSR